MNRLGLVLARLALLALILAAWEWLPRYGIVNPQLLPPLSDVLAMLGQLLGRTQVHEAIAVTAAKGNRRAAQRFTLIWFSWIARS